MWWDDVHGVCYKHEGTGVNEAVVGTALQCGHVVDMGNFGRSLHQSGVQGLWAARPGHQKQKMGDCKVKVNIFLLGDMEYPKDYRTFKGFLIY